MKAPTPDGLFHLESDTSREGVGGTLLQKEGDEWVVIGYHSKRLPKSAKNFGVIRVRIDNNLVQLLALFTNKFLFLGNIGNIHFINVPNTSGISNFILLYNACNIFPEPS